MCISWFRYYIGLVSTRSWIIYLCAFLGFVTISDWLVHGLGLCIYVHFLVSLLYRIG